MRVVAAVVLVGVLGGCTSVKMVQRDGCWVRRTEKRLLGTVAEEVGPCARPVTAFVENDPLTRMVQECVARADYRWQMRALAAWDRHEPWPAQLTESSVLQQCMDDSARGVLTETAALKDKNAALERRVSELVREQQAARERTEQERKELFSRSDEQRKDLIAFGEKLGDHLGAAAAKVQPAQPAAPAIATATATSEGRGTSEQATDSQAQPATLAVVPQGGPAGPVTATATLTPPPATPASATAAMCPATPQTAPRASAGPPPTQKKRAEVARQARSLKKARAKPAASAICPPAQPSASATKEKAPAAATRTAGNAAPAAAATPTAAASAAPVVEVAPARAPETARR